METITGKTNPLTFQRQGKPFLSKKPNAFRGSPPSLFRVGIGKENKKIFS
jgi:hypothetical protein